MDAANSKAQDAEDGIALVRLGIVLFNSFVYGVGLTPVGIPWLAWTVITTANIYSIFVLIWRPQFKSPILTATWTTLTDALLIAFWLTSTGMQDSPFVMLWAISLVAVAFRFGPRPTIAATIVYLVGDAALLAAWGQLVPLTGLALARLGYLAFFGALGTLMAFSTMESHRRERKLQKVTQELEERKAEASAIVRSAPSIIIRTDLEGKILFINRTAPGVPKDDVVGTTIFDFVDDDQASIVRAAMEQVLSTGEIANYEVTYNGPDGAMIFQSQMGPVRQGAAVVGVVILTIDVTEQHAQREAATQLEMREAALVQLEERDAFRRSLLNTVAHELNTPLTPLKLQLAILSRRYADEEGIDMLARNMDRLAHLVRDLLDVARVEQGQLGDEKTEHDLAGVVGETAQTFEPIAAANDVKIVTEASGAIPIFADRLRMTQVLYNLVSNAVKYSPPGATVTISCQVADEVTCRISDQGPGFSEEQKDKLFQAFGQVHATPAGHSGTGLGLYLTKSILVNQGGTIHVESDGPGKGSTFIITLPKIEAARPTSDATVDAADLGESPSGLRALDESNTQ